MRLRDQSTESPAGDDVHIPLPLPLPGVEVGVQVGVEVGVG